MAKELGVTRVAIPTAGNAGGAMAAYAARAGMEAYVFMPADTPLINQFEAALAGAKCFLVDGLINDPAVVPFAVVEVPSGVAVGIATYLRIDPAIGSLEVGSIMYGPRLAGSTGATEAMFLMAAHAFDDLGYRRYEWKCDSLNEPSRRAAGLRFALEPIDR